MNPEMSQITLDPLQWKYYNDVRFHALVDGIVDAVRQKDLKITDIVDAAYFVRSNSHHFKLESAE
jgi:hypothetical protein